MIIVKSILKKSEIHGTGLFTEEFVSKGQLVWEFKEGFDLVLSTEKLNELSEAAREQFLNYAYISKLSGDYVLCSDDSRFFNHCAKPNVRCFIPDSPKSPNDLICIANEDIEVGEELTCDYAEFDANPSDVMVL